MTNTQPSAITPAHIECRNVKPLRTALNEMRESLLLTSPGSCKLFDSFEPWVLAWAANPDALTDGEWLAERWRSFFWRRWSEIFDDLQSRLARRGTLIGIGFNDGLVEAIGLLRAFTAHMASRHRTIAVVARAMLNVAAALLTFAVTYAVFASLSVYWQR